MKPLVYLYSALWFAFVGGAVLFNISKNWRQLAYGLCCVGIGLTSAWIAREVTR